jgi:DNA-binding transcriptional LysR family regulator
MGQSDLNQIVVFARVAETGSFSLAARQLGLPKSTVSRKVAELEERMGARLMHRTTRKLGLTDAGRSFYAHAARIVAEIAEAEAAVGRMQTEPRGRLRVTAPLAFAMLGPIVAAYLLRHHDVQLEMVCTDRRLDLVEDGFDVAVRAGPLDDSTLVARPLGSFRHVLVAAPGYCKRHGTPRRPEDLGAHACLAFGSGAAPTLWTLQNGDAKAEVRLTPRLVVNDFDLLRDAALAGVGIAALADFTCAGHVAAGHLRLVLPDWRTTETPVHALYPTTRGLPPKVATFVELLRARLRFPAVPLAEQSRRNRKKF